MRWRQNKLKHIFQSVFGSLHRVKASQVGEEDFFVFFPINTKIIHRTLSCLRELADKICEHVVEHDAFSTH